MRNDTQNSHALEQSAVRKAVSAAVAAALVASFGAPAIAITANPAEAFADEAQVAVQQTAPESDAAEQPSEDASSAAPDSSDATASDPSVPATDEPAAPRPEGVINATVPLATTGTPSPVTEEAAAEAVEEEASWEDTTPEWNWPLTEDGYVAWDGTVVANAARKGIDVSQHQGWINWESVKAQGIDFAIIRCGYGSDMTEQDDSFWSYNVAECERLGIPYGVYLYSYATSVEEAASEAAHALRMIEGHTPDLPVYLDLEDKVQSRDESVRPILPQIASTFCETMRQAGYKPGVYANTYWWTHYLTDPVFDGWEKWVAQYNTSCEYQGTYKVWQASSKMTLDGTTSRYVDVNFDLGGRFRDVDYGASYVVDGSLDYVTSAGLMGPSGGAFDFRPADAVTRAQAVELLYNMAGRPAVGFAGVGNPANNTLPFDDVAADSPYCDAIRWARSIGMIGNTSADSAHFANVFNPDTPLTREEACTMLQAYVQNSGIETLYNPVSLITITDGFSVSPKAIDSVGWAVGNGVLPLESADGLRMVSPQGQVNRASMAQLLHNTWKLFQI